MYNELLLAILSATKTKRGKKHTPQNTIVGHLLFLPVTIRGFIQLYFIFYSFVLLDNETSAFNFFTCNHGIYFIYD